MTNQTPSPIARTRVVLKQVESVNMKQLNNSIYRYIIFVFFGVLSYAFNLVTNYVAFTGQYSSVNEVLGWEAVVISLLLSVFFMMADTYLLAMWQAFKSEEEEVAKAMYFAGVVACIGLLFTDLWYSIIPVQPYFGWLVAIILSVASVPTQLLFASSLITLLKYYRGEVE